MATTTARAAPAAREVPGPVGHPVIGNLLAFKNDTVGTLVEGFRTYGDIVRFRGLGPLFPNYLVVHPDHVSYVLKENAENYPRTPGVRRHWHALVGDGLICTEGELWRAQRKLAQPSFDPRRLQAFDGVIAEETAAMLERWDTAAEAGTTLDVAREMTRLALANVGRSLYSTDWREESAVIADAVEFTIQYTYKALTLPVAPSERLPIPEIRRFKSWRRRLEVIMERLIAQRRASGAEKDDLLGRLLSARDESGRPLSDYQLRSHLMTFMFGGHETVAIGMAWTWCLLSQHPEVRRKLETEIDEALNGAAPTFENTVDLDYLNRVINEALRLRPPVWLISRAPLQDDEIAGYPIPAGAQILVSPYVTHRHPAFWANPEGFDPDRWLPEQVAERPRNAWFPFSGGPHQCIGGYLGQMEMRIVIAQALQRFEPELVPGHPVVPRLGITMGFEHGLAMTVRRRPPLERKGSGRSAEQAVAAGAVRTA